MRIDFEDGANFITARQSNGEVMIRCNVQYTDLGETEPLPDFIERHGSQPETVAYLIECYHHATGI